MRIRFKESIKETIDRHISNAKHSQQEIEFIQLSNEEYIQFLEEIGHVATIVLKDAFTKERRYRGVRILVPT